MCHHRHVVQGETLRESVSAAAKPFTGPKKPNLHDLTGSAWSGLVTRLSRVCLGEGEKGLKVWRLMSQHLGGKWGRCSLWLAARNGKRRVKF